MENTDNQKSLSEALKGWEKLLPLLRVPQRPAPDGLH